MGAWDIGAFENDGALDWLDVLLYGTDLSPISNAFQLVLENDEYIEVDDAQAAVAACEVVALLRGTPAKTLPENLVKWNQTHRLAVDQPLVEQAVQSLEKVYADSELR